MKTALGLTTFCFTIALLSPGTAFAQNDESPLDDIFACADIENNNERWLCYDQQVPLLREREQKQEIVTIDSEKVKEIERDAFGFTLPKLNILRRNKDAKADNAGKADKKAKKAKTTKTAKKENKSGEHTFVVTSINRGRSGLKITMEDGQVWQQVTGSTGSAPKGKLSARIKRASFGSFLLSLLDEDGKSVRRGIRVKRVK